MGEEKTEFFATFLLKLNTQIIRITELHTDNNKQKHKANKHKKTLNRQPVKQTHKDTNRQPSTNETNTQPTSSAFPWLSAAAV